MGAFYNDTHCFIFSLHPIGYWQATLSSRHWRQTGVSPLHLVFRCLHDSHARGTRRLYRCVGPGGWRGIATFEIGKGPPSPSAGAEFDALPTGSVGRLRCEGRCVAGGALCSPDLSVASFSDASCSPGKLCAFFCFLLVIREMGI